MARKSTGNPRGRPPYATPLTPAETRVLAYVREGKHNAEIAVRLGISNDTVKYHVKNMLGKLSLTSRDELAQWKEPREGTARLARVAGWPLLLKLGVGAAAVGVAGFAAGIPFLSREQASLPDSFDEGEVITVGYDGSPANGPSGAPSISADGRYVAFSSMATNLVRDDRNDVSDIFVYDRQAKTMQRISMGLRGDEANEGSYSPVISADGRFVAFVSAADNLVNGDTNWPGGVAMDALIAADRAARPDWGDPLDATAEQGFRIGFSSDVFVYDRERGTTELVSVSSGGTQANLLSSSPSISADGSVVAFTSLATNLVDSDELPPPVHNSEPTLGTGDYFRGWHVYVRNRSAGTTERLTTHGEAVGSMASVSANGRYVTHQVYLPRSEPAVLRNPRPNVSIGDPPMYQVMLKVLDRRTGKVVELSRDTYTELSAVAVSDDGDTVFVADGALEQNLVHTSAAALNVLAVADHGGSARLWSPVMTRNGRFLAYTIAGKDPSIGVIDTVTGEEVNVPRGVGWEVPGVGGLAIAGNGRTAAFGVRLPDDWQGDRLAIYVAQR